MIDFWSEISFVLLNLKKCMNIYRFILININIYLFLYVHTQNISIIINKIPN